MYKLVYLPTAKDDISEAVLYIAEQLKSPKAAGDLLDLIEQSVLKLVHFPYAHKVYQTMKNYENEYRILPIKNYIVFYVVNEEEKAVEIYRIIYSKRDLNHIAVGQIGQ